MKLIRIKRRGQLRKWRRFTSYLFRCGVHHQREIWSCIPAKTKRTPYWYRRKMKRRRDRRFKRLERLWARYRKPKRLTEREVKIQQKKEFIEELYRRIKRMAPYYRMKQKEVAIKSINAFEALRRKLAVKRWLLDTFLKEQKLLVSQLLFIQTGSSLVETCKGLWAITDYTAMKIKGAQEFKDVLAQRKLINHKLAERRKFYMNILVPLAEYYHKLKNYENVLVPKYFSNVEKVVYQERQLIPKKTQKQRFLQVFGVSQMKYLQLKEAAKELGFYMQTRLFFTSKVEKILGKLYYAKEVVVELLRDGHEIVTRMFHFYEVYAYMVRLQIMIHRALIKKRLKLIYRRRRLEIKVEYLLQKHKMYVDVTGCSMCPEIQRKFFVIAKKEFTEAIRLPARGLNTIERRAFINRLQNLTTKLWEGFKDPQDWVSAEKISEHHISLVRVAGVYAFQRKNWIAQRNLYRSFIIILHEISRHVSVRTYYLNVWYKIIRPIFGSKFIKSLRKVILEDLDVDLITIYVHSLYKYLRRTRKYGFKKLGHFRFMYKGNQYECMRSEFIYFNNFLAFINYRLTKQERTKEIKARRLRQRSRALRKLKRLIIVPGTSKKKLKTFSIYKKPLETLCPLCCAAERKKSLYRVGIVKETNFNPSTIRKHALDTFYSPPSSKIMHDVLDCKEPAATFLVKIKILEDRRKLSYLGQRVWIDF